MNKSALKVLNRPIGFTIMSKNFILFGFGFLIVVKKLSLVGFHGVSKENTHSYQKKFSKYC